MRIRATIEVIDTEIDIDVDDNMSDADIMDLLDDASHEQVRVVDWSKDD